jgi:hypothetical protein
MFKINEVISCHEQRQNDERGHGVAYEYFGSLSYVGRMASGLRMSIWSSSIVTVYQSYCVSNIGSAFVFTGTGIRQKGCSVGLLSKVVLRLGTQQNMLSVSFCKHICRHKYKNLPKHTSLNELW